MEELYTEIIKIIKGKEEYLEIFRTLKIKYEKTGKLKGIIHLESPSKKASEFLFSISKKIDSSGKISVKAEEIFREFKASRFKELDDFTLMEKLYEKSLFSKKEVALKERSSKDNFFSELPLQEWIGNKTDRKIESLYRESPKRLRDILKNIEKFSKMIKENSELEEREYIPLASIAAIITKDSHYFDMDKSAGKLLMDYLCFISNREIAITGEEISELLMEFYIVRDEFFNFTMSYNLLGDGSWESFWSYKQPLNLSLYNIRESYEISGMEKKIFVVENPSVFRLLMEYIAKENLKATLICTSGQLNLSSLIILDRAIKNENRIFYSGDFDPEGLQIAQKLKLRYGKQLEFFHMEVEDYLDSLSDKSIEKRLVKLDKIVLLEFRELIEIMKKEKRAGYQELLVEKYKKFIRNS